MPGLSAGQKVPTNKINPFSDDPESKIHSTPVSGNAKASSFIKGLKGSQSGAAYGGNLAGRMAKKAKRNEDLKNVGQTQRKLIATERG